MQQPQKGCNFVVSQSVSEFLSGVIPQRRGMLISLSYGIDYCAALLVCNLLFILLFGHYGLLATYY